MLVLLPPSLPQYHLFLLQRLFLDGQMPNAKRAPAVPHQLEADDRGLLLLRPLGRLADRVEQGGRPLVEQEGQVQKAGRLHIESWREYVASLIINDEEVVPDLIGVS
jgi:hypothetical protein